MCLGWVGVGTWALVLLSASSVVTAGGSIQFTGDVPTFPWVRVGVWAWLGLGLREGWVCSHNHELIPPGYVVLGRDSDHAKPGCASQQDCVRQPMQAGITHQVGDQTLNLFHKQYLCTELVLKW